jgi:ABC-type glutathione transport system ATPase component
VLSVKTLNTEYRTGRGESLRAVRDVAFEVEKG